MPYLNFLWVAYLNGLTFDEYVAIGVTGQMPVAIDRHRHPKISGTLSPVSYRVSAADRGCAYGFLQPVPLTAVR